MRLRHGCSRFGVLVVLAVGVLGLLGSTPALAATEVSLYVTHAGAGTVCSEAEPCGSIQAAINTAQGGSFKGDQVTINVAEGAYTENDTISASELESLTIAGAGASSTTVNGNKAGTVLTVNSGIVKISGLRIENGKTSAGANFDGGGGNGGNGGGVYNAASLTISSSTISGNSTGAGGNVEEDSGIGGNGGNVGGIYNTATLTVASSTISGNSTGNGGNNEEGRNIGGNGGNGGGIYSTGTLGVSSSTISGNSTGGGGSGDYGGNGDGGGGGDGGGVYNAATSTITASTISENSTGAGGVGEASDGNGGVGGGIYNAAGTVNLKASILVRGALGEDCSGTITDEGYNIADDGSCEFTASTSTGGLNADLEPLANNGGETETQALEPGSPALSVIPASECPEKEDQRGLPRPGSGKTKCDIGAYETQLPSCTAVNGVGHIAPKGKEGENLRVHLSTSGGTFTTTTPNGAAQFSLRTLSSASCAVIPGGLEFSGRGAATMGGPKHTGYEMVFSFAAEGAKTYLSLEVMKGATVVYKVTHEPLTKGSKVKIS
jgi:hypothetical protein